MKELDLLGEHIATQLDAQLGEMPPNHDVRQSLDAHAIDRPVPKSRSGLATALSAAAVLALSISGAFLGYRAWSPEAALSFTVGDPSRPGVLNEWTSAAPSQTLPIRFSDGTNVTLESNARSRVVHIDSRGADLVIESGSADFEVAPRQKAEWNVRAGPFSVKVTGTRFGVQWSPQKDEFVLKLYEGGVTVSGCAFREGYPVAAGSEVRTSCGRGELLVRPITATRAPKPDATSASQDGPKPSDSEPESTEENTEQSEEAAGSSAPRAVRGAKATTETWRELVGDGRYRQAYAVANRLGFESQCQVATGEEVLLLGDAARLSGQSSHASFAYTTARKRFAGSAVAARAAFALGRLSFRGGNGAGSAQWFRTYLAERPSGQLAPIALGRLLEIAVRSGDSSGARGLAKRYLARYPRGPHAKQARKVLGRDQKPAKK